MVETGHNRRNILLLPIAARLYLNILTPDGSLGVAAAKTWNTAEAAKRLGVHRSTLLRWFAQGRISEVRRDRNNWRVFTAQDLERIKHEVRRNVAHHDR
jgi:excisionase family DNA binding protein